MYRDSTRPIEASLCQGAISGCVGARWMVPLSAVMALIEFPQS